MKSTAGEFGYEWDRYPEIVPAYETQFWRWVQPLDAAFFKGKRFLDAGCGTGRNSLWPLKAGAASGYAFDFDPRTVAVARRNLAAYPQCEVGQESIYALAREGEFDVVMCIGVLHHLAEPRQALENLVRALRPGGTLALWVYGRENNGLYLAFFNPLRQITSRLPSALCRWIARAITVALSLRLLLPTDQEYLKLLRTQSFRHRESIVFDQLLPSIANYWRREEVLALFGGLPVRVRHLTHTNGMSWTVVAEKNA